MTNTFACQDASVAVLPSGMITYYDVAQSAVVRTVRIVGISWLKCCRNHAFFAAKLSLLALRHYKPRPSARYGTLVAVDICRARGHCEFARFTELYTGRRIHIKGWRFQRSYAMVTVIDIFLAFRNSAICFVALLYLILVGPITGIQLHIPQLYMQTSFVHDWARFIHFFNSERQFSVALS